MYYMTQFYAKLDQLPAAPLQFDARFDLPSAVVSTFS